MKKYHLIIDVERCEDCNACLLSCKDEHYDNAFPGYTVSQPRHGQKWISLTRKERGDGSLMDVIYLPKPCQHCEDAPCVRRSDGAIKRRPDGIVLIDPVKAKGKSQLAGTCPHGAIFWNEEMKVAQKCTMCAHLLDIGWKEPRCAQVCPTGALKFVCLEDDEWRSLAKKEQLEALKPELGTRPGVLYRNLDLFTKVFIAGSVTVVNDGIEDCVEGARVVLSKTSKTVQELITDNYGDFKFDRLPGHSGTYDLTVESEKYGSAKLTVNLEDSVYFKKVVLA